MMNKNAIKNLLVHWMKANSLFLPFYLLALLLLVSCAKMGQPDGGCSFRRLIRSNIRM